MQNIPNCPKCASQYVYEDGELYICPECGYEWSKNQEIESNDEGLIVKDANGTVLKDGDDVALIKDLKVKGAKSDLKMGTKVKLQKIYQKSL